MRYSSDRGLDTHWCGVLKARGNIFFMLCCAYREQFHRVLERSWFRRGGNTTPPGEPEVGTQARM